MTRDDMQIITKLLPAHLGWIHFSPEDSTLKGMSMRNFGVFCLLLGKRSRWTIELSRYDAHVIMIFFLKSPLLT